MSSEDAEQAKTVAKRAGKQATHAAKNAGRAAALATAPVVDEIENTADDVVEAARKIDIAAVSRGLSRTGQGLIALSLAATAARFAFERFAKAKDASYVVGQNSNGPE